MSRAASLLAGFVLALACFAIVDAAPASLTVLHARPDAMVDLATIEGSRLVQGQWHYRDARIVSAEFRGPGPDLRPSGSPVRTHDIEPRADAPGFDDGWTAIEPTSIAARRGTGRLSLAWYRIDVTIPERIASFTTAGSTVVFEVVVDDYAEVWVDGRVAPALGQVGGGAIAGFNAPNRVVVARGASPGQRIRIAVLGANGPLSAPPANFIWIRSAALVFSRPRPAPAVGDVLRVDSALDAIVPPGTRVEKLASGFTFTEGPVWFGDALHFSDPNDNVIYRYTRDGELAIARAKSGYTGSDIAEYTQPGSNGLAVDREGRLTIAEHGNRRITRVERNGVVTVLADRYDGKRLNSPNDLVYRSDGTLYFTDPPFGLPRQDADPRRELPWSGVYRVRDGKVELLAKDLAGPNGLAFSPDERALYVANWDPARKIVMRYEVRSDGTLGEERVFADLTAAPGEEALDGLKVDQAGNVYVSGPGGVWILSTDGRHLGTIRAPELPANFAWGDADGQTLYLTARTGLYRIRLGIPGAGAHR
jgi:gluconolactonase